MGNVKTLLITTLAAATIASAPATAQTRGRTASPSRQTTSAPASSSSQQSRTVRQASPSRQTGSSVSRQTGSSTSSQTPSVKRSAGTVSPSRQSGSVSSSTAKPSTGTSVSPVRQTARTITPASESTKPSSGNVTTTREPAHTNPTPAASTSGKLVPSAPDVVRNPSGPGSPVPAGEGFRPARVEPVPPPAPRVTPRRQEPIRPDVPVRFCGGGPHYFGHRIEYLPVGYVRATYWGRDYYVCNGVYYRWYNSHYYVCRPPVGVVFTYDILDPVLTVCRFAYYADVCRTYSTINENASIITAQNEIIARNNATIAAQNQTIQLNNLAAARSYSQAENAGLVQSYASATTEYFYQDGVFYSKAANGQYVVINPPAGALVTELPDDYDTVTINDHTYFKVDDTLFKLTVVDGTAYFEVLGQLTGVLSDQYNLND